MNAIIRWFAENTVAANLLMALILLGGLSTYPQVGKEIFPSIPTNVINVSTAYLGAGPAEVEELITRRIEDAVSSIDGIEEITSQSQEGRSTVSIEGVTGGDMQRLLADVKNAVDSVNTLPSESERPLVAENKFQFEAVEVMIIGDVSEHALKRYTEKVRDDIALLPGVSQTEMQAVLSSEMSIELSDVQLRRYGLTFDEVVGAIRASSINLPAGTIRSDSGNIQVQTRGQAYTTADYEELVVRALPDGTVIRVGDVAKVKDGFEEFDLISQLDGQRSTQVKVSTGDNPDLPAVAAAVRNYVEQASKTAPEGIKLQIWRDRSEVFDGRMNLLAKNAAQGLGLVFIVLMLFLRPAVALWVAVGIAVSFSGAIWLMPATDTSFNMISMFALLMILGIVVDDAIISGESIHAAQHQGIKGVAGAVFGAQRVSSPVVFAVVSTMVFFAAMLFLPGNSAAFQRPIAMVVLLTLSFSLIESLLILPAHLAHLKPEKEATNFLAKFRQRIADSMINFAHHSYRSFLTRSVNNKRITVLVFTGLFAVMVAIYGAGYIRTSFFPEINSDTLVVRATIDDSAPFTETEYVSDRVVEGLRQLQQTDAVLNINGENVIDRSLRFVFRNQSYTIAEITDPTYSVDTCKLANAWREAITDLPPVKELRIDCSFQGDNPDISLQVSGSDSKEHNLVLELLKQRLASFNGVYDIEDSMDASRDEIEIQLKPHAENLGLTLASVARQVRQSFYGEEAQRIPRGNEDVRVMVRYPMLDRRTVDTLSSMHVRTPSGAEVPFETVAKAVIVPGYTTIRRVDRQRAASVTAKTVEGTADPSLIVQEILQNDVPRWAIEHPSVTVKKAGSMEDEAEFKSSLFALVGLAVFINLMLMAIAFKSYSQPLLIASAIPFGLVGALFGHYVMGVNMTMFSFLGVLAVAGIVVNDNLVLVDRINQLVRGGGELYSSVVQGGVDRFRAIVLTSVTTFVGLVPILAFEHSPQAQFLKPMVISLAFGVLFATFVTLVLTPTLYILLARIRETLIGEPVRPIEQHAEWDHEAAAKLNLD